jgi:23S rRNA (uracil1939-C5)-methyltransferase
MKEDAIVTIETIGGRGDGIAALDGERVYVPFSAPGDVVRVRLRRDAEDCLQGRIVELQAQGASRQKASCAHFGECGGCSLQHIEASEYRRWKLATLESALERQRIPTSRLMVEDMAVSPPGSRRRADLTVSRRADRIVIGFNAPRSHAIIDVEHCPVLRPALLRVIAGLRQSLREITVPGDRLEAKLCETDSGIDLLLVGSRGFTATERAHLAEFAEAMDLARISLGHSRRGSVDTIAQRRAVRVIFAGVPVAMPPGAFLQATTEGEDALVRFAQTAMAGARKIADLFCGLGTFAVPLARSGARVHAVDSDREAVAALERAVAQSMTTTLSAEVRDLEKRPLSAATLAGFDAVLLDPPRAGARLQSAELARSDVPLVCAISCHPGSFARDARILCEAGFRLERIRPVDQFLWSTHLELAALFRR